MTRSIVLSALVWVRAGALPSPMLNRHFSTTNLVSAQVMAYPGNHPYFSDDLDSLFTILPRAR
jgi:hypothetical protein